MAIQHPSFGTLEPDRVMPLRLYIRTSPEDRPAAKTRFNIVVQTPDGAIRSSAETTFEVPETAR